jgi:hypothetical protein
MPRPVPGDTPLAGTPPPSPKGDDDSVSIDSAGITSNWDNDVKDKDYELEPDPSDKESSQSVAPPPPDFNLFAAAEATFP